VKDGNESLKGEKQIWKDPKGCLDILNVGCVFACCISSFKGSLGKKKT